MRMRDRREFDFGGQWDLITELPQDWGNSPRVAEHRGCFWNQKGLDSGLEQHQRESGFVHIQVLVSPELTLLVLPPDHHLR